MYTYAYTHTYRTLIYFVSYAFLNFLHRTNWLTGLSTSNSACQHPPLGHLLSSYSLTYEQNMIFVNHAFLNFLLLVKELVTSDCRFGFYLNNVYIQLDMSRIPKFGQKDMKILINCLKNENVYAHI